VNKCEVLAIEHPILLTLVTGTWYLNQIHWYIINHNLIISEAIVKRLRMGSVITVDIMKRWGGSLKQPR